MEDTTMFEFSLLQPWGAASWRWHTAQWLIAQGRYVCRRRHGEWIARAVYYLRERRQFSTPRREARTARRWPDIHEALAIQSGPSRRRLEIECRLLARQSPAAVARHVGASPYGVRAYAHLFFDVVGRWDAECYILGQAIGMPLPGTGGVSVPVLMKASCYYHGPLALAAWLRYLDQADAGQPADLASEDGRQLAWIRLLVGLHNLPADQSSALPLLKVTTLLLEKWQNAARPRTLAQILARRTEQIVANLPWAVAAGSVGRASMGLDRSVKTAAGPAQGPSDGVEAGFLPLPAAAGPISPEGRICPAPPAAPPAATPITSPSAKDADATGSMSAA